MKNLLQSLHQKPIAVYPLYIDVTGSATAGMLLSQLMYWFSTKDKIFKTNEELSKETRLTIDELKSAKKKIKTLDFIKISLEGIPAKTYYEINWDKYEKTLSTYAKAQEFTVGGNPTNKEVEIPPTRKSRLQQPVGGNPTNKEVEIPPAIIVKSFDRDYSTETTTENLSPKSSLTKDELEIRSEFIDDELIKLFIAHRKEIKHPMTQQALNLFVKKLEKLSEKDDPEDLVNEAIINGWRSVFPPKENNRQTTSYSNPTSATIRNTFAKLEKLQKEKQNYIEGEIQ
ncbi:MAG: hypothetical protein WC253_03295 [Sulfurovaceae bacterium]